MNFRSTLMAQLLGIMVIGTSALCKAEPPRLFSQLGVNLAGAEFSAHRPDFSNRSSGTHEKDYVYPDLKTMQYFSSNGLRLFRIPFRWERIQPHLGKPLNTEELARLKKVVKDAKTAQAYVILDLHNYARYRTQKDGKAYTSIVGDIRETNSPPVTIDHLCDAWHRLSQEFQGHPSVIGYGIMNEPHDIPENGPSWHAISRAVVKAIRKVDPETTILVPGSNWSSARRFPEVNGPTAWIDPKIPNIVYEAHLYFDHNGSGTYHRGYSDNLKQNHNLQNSGTDYVRPFLKWCKTNKVQGFIGEFGTPPDPQWLAVLDDFLKTIQDAEVGGCYWAAGPWWGNYPLSIQPKNGNSDDAPQMKTLKRYTNDRQ